MTCRRDLPPRDQWHRSRSFAGSGRSASQRRQPTTPKIVPLKPVPLQTLVVNVTNQCNLACTYCYEYGEDKIVDTENGQQPKFMSEQTARESVEFMLRESKDNPTAHMTFFGGETLMNFPVLQSTVAYARRRAAEVGKQVDFSLTTNATLLRPDVIDFLADNRIGVTISIDGPEDMQDKFRVFKNGMGSYDVAAPKIKALLARHRTRPIGARVTLTRQTLDVARIYRHLADEMGFWEVGFAPVTTAAKSRLRHQRRGIRRAVGAVQGAWPSSIAMPRSRIAITGSRMFARRFRSCTRVTPRLIHVVPALV